MRYLERRPGGPLAAFVERLWLIEGPAAAAAPQVICPDGRMEVVLHLGNPVRQVAGEQSWIQPRVLLAGALAERVAIAPTGAVSMVGARFAPGALSAWLGIPGDVLTGMLDLEAVGPAVDRDTPDRLAGIGDPTARLAAFESVLAARVPDASAVDPLVTLTAARLEATLGRARLEPIAAAAGVGRRQLERRFTAAVGLPPRLFGRLVRFQAALALIGQAPGAEIASRCGYADQAHLVREARRFAGDPPGRLADAADPLTAFFRMS